MNTVIHHPMLPGVVVLVASLLVFTAAGLWVPQGAWGTLNAWWRRAPRVTGGIAGIGVLWSAIMVAGMQVLPVPGPMVVLVGVLGGIILGVYLPGTPERMHRRRKWRLTVQTADFLGYMTLRVGSTTGDADLLQGYIRRPDRTVRDLQAIIAAAIRGQRQAQRGDLYDLLVNEAAETGNAALLSCAQTLQHGARQSRQDSGPVLEQQQTQLLETVVEQAKQQAQRLELVLIAVCAVALVLGLGPFILYVATGGGEALRGL